MANILQFMKNAWRGQERLWKVFLLAHLPLMAFLLSMIWMIGTIDAGMEYESGNFEIVDWLSLAVNSLIYPIFFWVLVSEWRCAYNVESPAWGYLMRVFVVLNVFVTLKAISMP